jgi:hypothetical protein
MGKIQGRSDMDDALKGPLMQRAMKVKADQIARAVQRQGIRVGDRDGGSRERELPVLVSSSVTDRAKSTVVLAHPAGLAVQAKHGALTKAAAEAGMQVRSR